MRTPMFVDAIKTSRKFGSPDQPWDGKAKVDARGWPIGDFGMVVFTDTPQSGGTYHLVFDGKADVSTVASTAEIRNVKFDGGRTVADVVVPNDGTQLMLAFRNTQHVANVRFIRPGYPADTRQIFTNLFINSIKPYQTLRLMDYLQTNGNPLVHWSDRPLPDSPQYTAGKGGSYEPMIALANASGKDLWVNVPDQADDDYVHHMAELFKSSLKPGRHVYLEYSNEVWNWSFPQAGRNKDAAKREAADPKSILNVVVDPDDDAHNETYQAFKRIPERLLQIRKIWLDVYGKARFDQTVRPVLASQIGWPFVLQEQIGFIAHNYGPPSKFIYGIAGAPYFGMGGQESKSGLTKDQVLDALSRSVDDYAGLALVVYPIIAHKYGVKLLAYEGGVDIGQGDQSLDAKLAAQSDPRMREITRRYLDAWYGHGGSLFMYFTLCSSWNKWGAWGLTDDLTKSTPKTQAVADVLSSPPPPIQAGIAVPGTITGADYALMRWGTYDRPAKGPGNVGHLGRDDVRDYLVDAARSGPAKLLIRTTQPSDAVMDVALDTTPAKAVPTAGGFTVSLAHVDAGLHALHIGMKNGSVDITSIDWSR
jgi:hypothetical protein